MARLALQCVRGNDETAGVAGAHRLFDRHDRLDPILAKIAENADESGAQLTPRRAKFIPIDQDLVQCSVPWCMFWRSDERSVGKECVSTCRSRWSRSH